MAFNVIEIDDDDHPIQPTFELVKAKPRKIVFCIDISLEMNTELKASLNNGLKDTNMYFSTRLETIQRFLKRYTHMNALVGNEKDEYAMVLLSDKATWWRDFTKDTNIITSEIDMIDGEVITKYKELDTQSIFDIIAEKVNVNDSSWFIQMILIYSRETVIPSTTINKDYLRIRESPNFTLDVLYLHDKLSETSQNIYDFWNKYDSDVVPGWYYETGIFQGKDALAKALSQLIAHPSQRHKDQELIETPFSLFQE